VVANELPRAAPKVQEPLWVAPDHVVNRSRASGYLILAALLSCFAAPSSFAQRVQLAPRLRTGQTFFYRIDFSGSRTMKTESHVASPQLPPGANVSTSGLLQVEVVEATPAGFRLKTYYSERDASAASETAVSQPAASASTDKVAEVSISALGSASEIKGLDKFSTAQQFAWNDWLARFTSSMAFPYNGITPGQKWQAVDRETTPSPIAGLIWTKKYQYVRDEPCRFYEHSVDETAAKSRSIPQTCAVVLVRARLRQESSPKNATPEDYKMHDLKTRGTAAGQNETILYISRSTGILIRSTEDAQQFMDATVALSDGTNQVRYNLNARSHSDIFLLPDSPPESH